MAKVFQYTVKLGSQISTKNLDETRIFNFYFRDSQAEKTLGWASARFFNFGKNAQQLGIMTRFKATESFGPKTPVGLESTSILFPQ